MSQPSFFIRRVYVEAGAAEDLIPEEVIQASVPKAPEVPPYLAGVREPQTPQEMVEYLNAKNAGTLPQAALVAPAPAKKKGAKAVDAPPAFVKKHPVMPKSRPKWVDEASKAAEQSRQAKFEARRNNDARCAKVRELTQPAPRPVPMMKVRKDDGTIVVASSLADAARKIVGRKATAPAAKKVVKKGRR